MPNSLPAEDTERTDEELLTIGSFITMLNDVGTQALLILAVARWYEGNRALNRAIEKTIADLNHACEYNGSTVEEPNEIYAAAPSFLFLVRMARLCEAFPADSLPAMSCSANA